MKSKSLFIVLWVARIWGGLISAFVLFMLTAHVYSVWVLNEPSGTGLKETRDLLTFLCFPVGTLLGLLLAYRYAALGGAITCLSLLLMFVIILSFDGIREFDQSAVIFLGGFMPPGILYIVYGMTNKEFITKTP